jgi:hypothetical protein
MITRSSALTSARHARPASHAQSETVVDIGSTEPITRPDAQTYDRPDVVPYITTWSAELSSEPTLVVPGSVGIAYRDEGFNERDIDGVLWSRTPSRPRVGRPVFSHVHPLRQRRVMRSLRCQICAGPADRTEHGVLWVLHDDRDDWHGWPENMAATHPPVCLTCAPKAIRLCPHLCGGYVAVRVQDPEPYGVYGTLYRPGPLFAEPVNDVTLPYGDPRIPMLLASQLALNLEGCTIVDLADELAMRGSAEGGS